LRSSPNPGQHLPFPRKTKLRIRINDAGNVFFYTARPEQAEELLKRGLAAPEGRGKKIRCLRLTVGRGQAWAFLRGGRSVGQASQTIRVERVGDKRLPVYQHIAERCEGFRPDIKVVTASEVDAVPYGIAIEPKPDEVSVTVTETPAVNTGAIAELVLESLQFIPEERGSLAEREGEGVTTPADLATPRLCEGRCNDQPEHITHASTVLPAEQYDISRHRDLARAIIVRAFQDSQSDPVARRWFEASQGMLEFWCSVAGLDPGQVRKRAQQICPDAALATL
jgi:hypothetical protein